ncbi:MAG: OmpA family protein [Deltaproteobacteria bacterium]|uniref:OmpA family protein n=1 Tax=Desulfobacula sp. TaxID=2593537 RepID=UPI0019C0DDD0|nr:OmpA family protein [Candidatus Desulfobacula maris]MBL6994115.1 OmpA family protein [Desulfobacula sp.]
MRLLTRSLLTLFAFLFLFGCAAKQMSTPVAFEPVQFDKAAYSSKVDNFLIIFDSSSSMRYPLEGETKFDKAKTVVNRLNVTLPEMGQTGGLRSFGHSSKVSNSSTELIYGMEKYSTANLDKAFQKIVEPGGTSPLYKALNDAKEDFKGLSGERNAVVIISDGEELPGNVLASAKALKEIYGPSICFHTVLVGDSPEGEALLQEISKIGGCLGASGDCGFFTTADKLLNSPEDMACFVESVFLDKIAAPAPVVVPKKEIVKEEVWVLGDVLFGSGSSVIKPGAYYLLDDIAAKLEEKPGMSIDIQGHTDNIGSAESNKELSSRRAQAVKNYLIGKGIMPDRMTTEGFGFSKPVALNGTEAGRALNRRVEIRPF